jgi:hypothetical protein
MSAFVGASPRINVITRVQPLDLSRAYVSPDVPRRKHALTLRVDTEITCTLLALSSPVSSILCNFLSRCNRCCVVTSVGVGLRFVTAAAGFVCLSARFVSSRAVVVRWLEAFFDFFFAFLLVSASPLSSSLRRTGRPLRRILGCATNNHSSTYFMTANVSSAHGFEYPRQCVISASNSSADQPNVIS